MFDIPFFSVTFASRRPQYFQNFYDSISANTSIPFEVIFVGPNPPTKKMPDNFIHIMSDATPCECIEIAVRQAKGEFLLLTSDDLVFSDNFLNKLYNYTQRIDTNKALMTFRLWLTPVALGSPSGNGFMDDGLVFEYSMLTGTVIGCAGAFRRDIWLKLGGLDRRFFGPLCDVDMQMRFYEYGMNPFFPPDCTVEEIMKNKGIFKEKNWKKKSLLLNHGLEARKLLNSLWIKDGAMSQKRLDKVHSFGE